MIPSEVTFTVTGEPKSKARPRVVGRRTYTEPTTAAAEERMAWSFLAVARGYKARADVMYEVECSFYCGVRQRRDIDNMVKLVCDSLNGVAWADDSQVMRLVAEKHYVERPEARTVVTVREIGPNLPRTIPCAGCGADVPTPPGYKGAQRFCSKACRWEHQRRTRTAVRDCACEQCGATFTASHAARFCSEKCEHLGRTIEVTCHECAQVFRIAPSIAAQRGAQLTCSAECRVAYWRRVRAVRASGTCSVCGGSTSKKQYRRCRACFVEGRLDGT